MVMKQSKYIITFTKWLPLKIKWLIRDKIKFKYLIIFLFIHRSLLFVPYSIIIPPSFFTLDLFLSVPLSLSLRHSSHFSLYVLPFTLFSFLFYPIQFYPFLFYPFLLYLFLFYPFLFYLFLFYPYLFYPLLFYSFLF